MAIIRGVRGLEVTIKVAGEKAQEYDPTENTTIPADLEFHIPDCIGSETPRSDDNIPYVVKFVEATPGALFHIRVKQLVNFQFSSHHIGYSVAVDSLTTGVSHEECDKNRQLGIPWDAKSSHWISKDETGAWQRNYFRFAQLPVDETDCSCEEMKNQVERTKKVGVIRVFFYHLEASDSYCEWTGRTPDNARPIREAVPEKALKGRAVDCQVDWKSTPTSKPEPYKAAKFTDAMKRPFAVYEFRYRTMEGLMREGVISRPVDEAQPAGDDELTELKGEDARQAAQKCDIRQKHVSSGERTPGNEEPPRGIKRERESGIASCDEETFLSRYKARRLENGAFKVDLTGDD